MKELNNKELECINGGNWESDLGQVGLLANNIWGGIERGANSVTLVWAFKNEMNEALHPGQTSC